MKTVMDREWMRNEIGNISEKTDALFLFKRTPEPKPAPAPRRKLWPSMAERVDAVDWGKWEKIADREMREFNHPAAWEIINGMLDKLDFPDIRIVAYTQKLNDIGLFTVAPTMRNHTRNVENGMAVTLPNYSSSSIAGVTRRILEAVREWSVTDAGGGAKANGVGSAFVTGGHQKTPDDNYT